MRSPSLVRAQINQINQVTLQVPDFHAAHQRVEHVGLPLLFRQEAQGEVETGEARQRNTWEKPAKKPDEEKKSCCLGGKTLEGSMKSNTHLKDPLI